ncbi:UDP-glucose/GDP-mannose dehydrogenase family protein [Sinanaerobacter chloroacetimidivorans]|uniref:UDP-glucose dehydrogenase family protein n=1 Tax=Sinanaerobacter chloroacetimidivorans TaxID=2818044 RepID=UPI0029C9FED9|nr:UDP-glucose/GDP-mannose dehydrogenase family protein [Sinanaerobacter chloroacetimidivorans]
MKITVIGTGYVGLVAGLGFSDFGNDVVSLDTDQEKIDKLVNGQAPIYEPGIEELLSRNLKAKRIIFTTDKKYAIEHGNIIFICVGTPQTNEGDVNLDYVYQVAHDIGSYINQYKIIVNKSTVPVGTAREIGRIIKNTIEEREALIKFDIASNPEFLREGKAINDFFNPDRIVLGTDNAQSLIELNKIYRVFARSNKPIIKTSIETAEMIKYATNSFLATKITFINEMANLCEKVGANVLEVASAMGKDGRISPKFLHPGPGYGGSCFPKDTKALVNIAKKHGAKLSILESVILANEFQKKLASQKIIKRFPTGGTIALLGLAFKPDTDDVRESPALEIIRTLASTGLFQLNVYDPQAMIQCKNALAPSSSEFIKWCSSAFEACRQADAVAIITEWFEFRNMDLEELKILLNSPVIFDFRNIFRKDDLESLGYEYYGVGI